MFCTWAGSLDLIDDDDDNALGDRNAIRCSTRSAVPEVTRGRPDLGRDV